MVVTLPFVLLLLDYWPLGRLRFGPGGGVSEEGWRSVVVEKIPLIMVSIAAGLWNLLGGEIGRGDFARRRPGAVRPDGQCVGFLCPVPGQGLLAGEPRRVLSPSRHAAVLGGPGAALLLALLSFGVLWLGRRYAYLPVGWFWYLGVLFPVSGILVQPGTQALADRYTYLPLIGFSLAVVWGVGDLLSRRGRFPWAPAAGMVFLAMLLIFSWRQVQLWQDSVRLFEHTVAVTKNNASTYYNLGNVYAMKGQYGRALESYDQALRIRPSYPDVYNSIGVVLWRQGRMTAALEQYARPWRSIPRMPMPISTEVWSWLNSERSTMPWPVTGRP
jgi:hypothetical protein